MIESAEEFVRLRSSTDPAEYHRAAHEPAEVATWLDVIARYPEMRSWVADNKTVPHSILAILVTDPSVDVRITVATKRKLTLEMFMVLANDPDENVRSWLTSNAKLPESVRAILAHDPSPRVRRQLAESGLREGRPRRK